MRYRVAYGGAMIPVGLIIIFLCLGVVAAKRLVMELLQENRNEDYLDLI